MRTPAPRFLPWRRGATFLIWALQGRKINLSLTTLGHCIHALSTAAAKGTPTEGTARPAPAPRSRPPRPPHPHPAPPARCRAGD